MTFVHHPGYTVELPTGHPFPMAKFRALRETLAGLDLDDAIYVTPAAATDEDLLRVHPRQYLRAFRSGDIDARAQRRTGFKWSTTLVRRTLLEVGGTLETVARACREGLACNTAGGTHHAFPDHGNGYCLLNDLAAAAATALDRGWARRVLIVDLDVHQGDGTAFIFDREPRVFTFSMHGAGNFPARKQLSDLDVPLPRGVGDGGSLAELGDHLPEVLRHFGPDLVLYDAGVDVHRQDRLGQLELTDDGLARRDAYAIRTCRDAGIAVAAVIGGGYDRDLQALAQRHASLHRAAISEHRRSRDALAMID